MQSPQVKLETRQVRDTNANNAAAPLAEWACRADSCTPQASQGSSVSAHGAPGGPMYAWVGASSPRRGGGRTYLAFEREGEVIRVGDCAYLKPNSDAEQAYIVLIDDLWESAAGTKYLHGSWLYRPAEALVRPKPRMEGTEVLLSDCADRNYVESVMSRVPINFSSAPPPKQPPGESMWSHWCYRYYEVRANKVASLTPKQVWGLDRTKVKVEDVMGAGGKRLSGEAMLECEGSARSVKARRESSGARRESGGAGEGGDQAGEGASLRFRSPKEGGRKSPRTGGDASNNGGASTAKGERGSGRRGRGASPRRGPQSVTRRPGKGDAPPPKKWVGLCELWMPLVDRVPEWKGVMRVNKEHVLGEAPPALIAQGGCRWLALSQDGGRVGCASGEGSVTVWDLEQRAYVAVHTEEQKEEGGAYEVLGIAFSNGGTRLCMGGR